MGFVCSGRQALMLEWTSVGELGEELPMGLGCFAMIDCLNRWGSLGFGGGVDGWRARRSAR
jgi:hypothetical protein